MRPGGALFNVEQPVALLGPLQPAIDRVGGADGPLLEALAISWVSRRFVCAVAANGEGVRWRHLVDATAGLLGLAVVDARLKPHAELIGASPDQVLRFDLDKKAGAAKWLETLLSMLGDSPRLPAAIVGIADEAASSQRPDLVLQLAGQGRDTLAERVQRTLSESGQSVPERPTGAAAFLDAISRREEQDIPFCETLDDGAGMTLTNPQVVDLVARIGRAVASLDPRLDSDPRLRVEHLRTACRLAQAAHAMVGTPSLCAQSCGLLGFLQDKYGDRRDDQVAFTIPCLLEILNEKRFRQIALRLTRQEQRRRVGEKPIPPVSYGQLSKLVRRLSEFGLIAKSGNGGGYRYRLTAIGRALHADDAATGFRAFEATCLPLLDQADAVGAHSTRGPGP